MTKQYRPKRRKPGGGRLPKFDYMPRDGRVIIDPVKLRYWRNIKGITAVQLAELVHLSPVTIRSYEKARRAPREAAFRRICTALGIGPEDLLLDGGRYVPRQEGELHAHDQCRRHRQGEEAHHPGSRA